jgi:hypothetical protein
MSTQKAQIKIRPFFHEVLCPFVNFLLRNKPIVITIQNSHAAVEFPTCQHSIQQETFLDYKKALE